MGAINPVSWNERRLATTTTDHGIVRLCEPQGGRFPRELSGCEQTYQLGMWLSDVNRPRGHMRYDSSSKHFNLERLHYLPAGIGWSARFDEGGQIKPAIYCDFEAS